MNERLSKAAAGLRLGVDTGEAVAKFHEFLDIFAELGRDPEALKREDAQAFLRETAPLIRTARVPLGEVVSDLPPGTPSSHWWWWYPEMRKLIR